MSKHTEGPWEAVVFPGDWGLRGAVFIQDASYKDICYVEYTTPYCMGASSRDIYEAATAKANAHLIAAAPDLLAALKSIVEGHDEIDLFTNARAAIAKAEGRTAKEGGTRCD